MSPFLVPRGTDRHWLSTESPLLPWVQALEVVLMTLPLSVCPDRSAQTQKCSAPAWAEKRTDSEEAEMLLLWAQSLL